MATPSYESALELAVSLSHEERLRLIEALAARTPGEASPKVRHSILELCGLGSEIWRGVDAQEYVRNERSVRRCSLLADAPLDKCPGVKAD